MELFYFLHFSWGAKRYLDDVSSLMVVVVGWRKKKTLPNGKRDAYMNNEDTLTSPVFESETTEIDTQNERRRSRDENLRPLIFFA